MTASTAPSFAKALKAVEGLYVTDYSTHDLRFPTSLSGDGTDAMNTTCDYSAAYVVLYVGPKGTPRAEPPSSIDQQQQETAFLRGHGMTFTIGRGNDICCHAIESICSGILLGSSLTELFSDMGATWRQLVGDPQLRWLGPEKGVIHLATAAVINALWDLFARAEGKPLWRLVSDMTPQEVVDLIPFRYITDALTKEEALAILQGNASSKTDRRKHMESRGYPAYTTSAGWSGYDDDKVRRLTKEALAAGFTHFKIKVGTSLEADKRRLALVRGIVDDPAQMPAGYVKPAAERLVGKNASERTGCVVMIDSNQVFDVPEAIEYVSALKEYRPWFIEEPTAPDDALGHAAIRKGLAEHGIAVATGEHAHSRIVFKQLLQADAIDVVQIDSCRLAGVNEVLAVMLMAKKFGKIVSGVTAR
ncbi:enolase C-terminal domain-like protein [Jaminaea rosea]|uniref:Enolase C-terminal domain-like protein n=1 Tax=Jaminaea rosea TaxID=1569628 RepID=A0A316UVK6_9BASI|nr:enolase C-terminal domain-like protein [Jaminaea rosea]PWN27155.1 enolase C-terminal domain-like protein [Jaminaea rosea]